MTRIRTHTIILIRTIIRTRTPTPTPIHIAATTIGGDQTSLQLDSGNRPVEPRAGSMKGNKSVQNVIHRQRIIWPS